MKMTREGCCSLLPCFGAVLGLSLIVHAFTVSGEEEDFKELVGQSFVVELLYSGLELAPVSALQAKVRLSELHRWDWQVSA